VEVFVMEAAGTMRDTLTTRDEIKKVIIATMKD
jgi:hypothetical protein